MTDDLDGRVWREVCRTCDALRRREDAELRQFGITSEQFGVLEAVHSSNSLRVTDLARELARSVNSISMLVDRMLRSGLLKRVRSRNDRRTVYVSLTPNAEDIRRRAVPVYQVLVRRAVFEVSDTGKGWLESVLAAMRGNVSEE